MKFQKGMTLIEIMAAMVIFGVALAGVAALSLTNVRSTAHGQVQSQATILGEELADTMRANLLGYESNKFSNTPEGTEKSCVGGTSCDSGEQAAYDAYYWVGHAAQALPGGIAIMCMDSTPNDGQPSNPACDGNGMNTIKLFWKDSRNVEVLAEGEDYHRHVVSIVP